MPQSALSQKLGIKAGHKALVLNAPEGYAASLAPLPDGGDIKTGGQGTFDFVQLFCRNKADVDAHAGRPFRR